LLLLLMQFPVQLDVTAAIRKACASRLRVLKDTSMQQGISALVSFYSAAYFTFLRC